MTGNPPALTRDTYERARHEVMPHDHAVHAYGRPEELVAGLRAFIEDGLRRNEMCVFVHSFAKDDEAWALLEKARPGAKALGTDKVVLVSLYTAAFQGDRPKIDYDHVKGVVESLIAAASSAGRAGVRIFVDASRRYFAEHREKEWFDFESWLGRRLHHSVGLVCAYQRSDVMRSDIFPDVLRTHAYRFDARPASP